jgi:hypothetical protein
VMPEEINRQREWNGKKREGVTVQASRPWERERWVTDAKKGRGGGMVEKVTDTNERRRPKAAPASAARCRVWVRRHV